MTYIYKISSGRKKKFKFQTISSALIHKGIVTPTILHQRERERNGRGERFARDYYERGNQEEKKLDAINNWY